MIYVDYKGNDTYEYTLTDGRVITLTDLEIEDICVARKKQETKGFRGNSELGLLNDVYENEDKDEE